MSFEDLRLLLRLVDLRSSLVYSCEHYVLDFGRIVSVMYTHVVSM
jgi:hypothetical protein